MDETTLPKISTTYMSLRNLNVNNVEFKCKGLLVRDISACEW